MKDPASGPFLFDTSANVLLSRTRDPELLEWYRTYARVHEVHVSAVTVIERTRGYALAWHHSDAARRAKVEAMNAEYLRNLGPVLPIDTRVAVFAAEIMALLPNAPLRRKRSHRETESRSERLSRWRFDVMIAATALVAGMTLIHNNADDFETIRGAIERSPARFPKLGPLELVRCQAVA